MSEPVAADPVAAQFAAHARAIVARCEALDIHVESTGWGFRLTAKDGRTLRARSLTALTHAEVEKFARPK